MPEPETIDIVFDGPPGPECGRFVEVEDSSRKSISVGEWRLRNDGYWVLRIPWPQAELARLRAYRALAEEMREWIALEPSVEERGLLARALLAAQEEIEELKSKAVSIETTWSEACKVEARDCGCWKLNKKP